MARVVFLGTPQAAVPTLESVDKDHDIALVITRPDRPKGRSRKPVPPPVKEYALEHGLDVAQPANRSELVSAISTRDAFDVGVVVAYGMILPPEVLEAPDHGLVNVHFSLLPRWRGAAPVARALMAGDEMTGVSIMRLDEGLDTGPILTAQAIDIDPDENSGELTRRLADVGARLLASSFESYLSGTLTPVPQSDQGVTYADKITSSDRPLDIETSPGDFTGKVRGLAPDPAATLEIDGETHKILQARRAGPGPEPGTWVVGRGDDDYEGYPIVAVGGAGVAITRLQPPGKKPMSGEAWLRGRRSDHGVVA